MAISTVRPSVKAALVLACLAALAGVYFSNTPLPLFLTRLKEIGIAILILWSAGGLGFRLLMLSPWRKPEPRDANWNSVSDEMTEVESFLFAEVLGLGCLSSLMILLGILGVWVPAGGWILVALGMAASQPFIDVVQRVFQKIARSTTLSSDIAWPAAALWTGGLLSFVFALAPITYYDSLVYHFAMPAAYLRAHHWIPMRGLIYSSFPQNLEMLWSLALLVGDDTVANLVAWSMSVYLLAAVAAYGRRFMNLSVGLVAAALLALMPCVLLLSSGGYVDIGLTLFCFMALYAACLWNEKPARGWLMVGGLLGGWAIGIKYTGALPIALIQLFLAVRLWRREKQNFWTGLLTFKGSALLVFGPWLIKNTLFVGNPVFPFLYKFGSPTMNPWVNDAAAGYFAGITEYYSRPLWALPGVLWETAVNGMGFGRGVDMLGDFGWLPLIALLPALWLCRQRSYYVRLLMILSLAFFGFWALSRPVLRFLLPVSPLWALLAGYAWVHGLRPQASVVRWTSRGFIGAFLLSGLFLFFYTSNIFAPFGVALGIEDRAAYLERKLNYYGAAEFVNTQTPPGSRVYIFGDQRGYYYERDIMITPVFSKNPMTQWANTAPDAKALFQTLKSEGITHVLVNRAEFDRLKSSYPNLRFTAQGQTNWDHMQSKLLSLLYHDRTCDVYAL